MSWQMHSVEEMRESGMNRKTTSAAGKQLLNAMCTLGTPLTAREKKNRYEMSFCFMSFGFGKFSTFHFAIKNGFK